MTISSRSARSAVGALNGRALLAQGVEEVVIEIQMNGGHPFLLPYGGLNAMESYPRTSWVDMAGSQLGWYHF